MAGANFRSSRTNCEPSIPGIKWSVITAPMFSCPTLLRSRASAAFADVAAWLSIPAFRNTNSRMVNCVALSSSSSTCLIGELKRSSLSETWLALLFPLVTSLRHETRHAGHALHTIRRPAGGSLLEFLVPHGRFSYFQPYFHFPGCSV